MRRGIEEHQKQREEKARMGDGGEMKQQHDNDPLFIRESAVRELLKWNDCVDAMESALVAAATSWSKSADQPFSSSQTPRTFTSVGDKGVLLTMPGFIGNYPLSTVTGDEKHSTLACKLVTSFSRNSELNPPLPRILATILMFHSGTGRLEAIIEGTEITAWRTAAVSLAATKHLFYNSRRVNSSNDYTLAICGTGAQVLFIKREIIQFKFNDSNLSSFRVEFMRSVC